MSLVFCLLLEKPSVVAKLLSRLLLLLPNFLNCCSRSDEVAIPPGRTNAVLHIVACTKTQRASKAFVKPCEKPLQASLKPQQTTQNPKKPQEAM